MPHTMRRPAIATAAVLGILAGWTATASAITLHPPVTAMHSPLTLAVIGDTPYDDAQLAGFPKLVHAINAAPNVRAVVHLGDIKGGQACTDDLFNSRRTLYETFADPFVFTPGDNEWTDCYRAQFGGYIPTDPLARLRKIFYPHPHRALGGHPPLAVLPQSVDPNYRAFVENVMWAQAGAVLATVDVTGSNNDLVPWFGDAETDAQRVLQQAEFDGRLAADLSWLDHTFAAARRLHAHSVVLFMQANTFVATLFPGADVTGFNVIVQRIADLAKAFKRPVLLLQGDTHEYIADKPLAAGDANLGVTTQVPNLTRVVVQGTTSTEWLRLQIEPSTAHPFSWKREYTPGNGPEPEPVQTAPPTN